MPQMAPISWLILFILFSFYFIIFNMMNYYCFNNKIQNKQNNFKKNIFTLNWKW